MKRMKKIIVLLLAAMMTMAMTITAFAEEGAAGTAGVEPAAAGTNTLTVNVKSTTPAQDLNGQTINLYKLFDVTESKSGETTNYAYTVNAATGYKDALVSVLGSSITASSTDEQFAAAVLAIGSNDSTGVQEFANKFTTYALTKSLAVTATSGKITGENTTSYGFTGLDAGYYLVYVTGGKEIQSSLVTVDETTTTVNLKTEAPSITKKADKETVNIGDVVTYTVTGSIPDTTGYDQYQYIIHDELSTGLDFVNDANGTALGTDATTVKVTVAFKDATDASTAPTTATISGEGNRKMALDLSEWVRANQENNKGKEFTVTYYAKVNKNAVVTEKNKAQLEYGNKPGETTTTTPSEAKTPTYPLDILKIKKGTEEILAGAHFTLYASTTEGAIDESKPIKVTKDADGKYSYAADQASTDPSVITDMVTVATKFEGTGYNLHINGLAAGTYYLKETKAPEGYNKLTEAIKVTITKSTTEDETKWTLTVDKGTVDGKIVKVENSTGSLLLSTGGRGTIAFAVIAALLVFGVAVSYIRDKRKEAK